MYRNNYLNNKHQTKNITYFCLMLFLFLSIGSIAYSKPHCGQCEFEKHRPKQENISQNNQNIGSNQQTAASTNKSSSEEDEFLPLENQPGAQVSKPASGAAEDEFLPLENVGVDSVDRPLSVTEGEGVEVEKELNPHQVAHLLRVPVIALLMTILAGFLVRFKPTRNLRGLFLVLSIFFLGFFNGACPCPISSFSNTIILITGGEVNWLHAIWFIALIPITYIFGKVWCGWICHLGALQEFLYLPGRVKFFQGKTTQNVMRVMRYLLILTLVVQVIATQTYLFDDIDPFRVAYNLGAGATTTSWILLGLLLVSSLFINRPFCRAACPIGWLLGLIAKIPGSSVLGNNGKCNGCVNCSSSACKIQAFRTEEKQKVLYNTDCIACGDCIDACKSKAVSHLRKSKTNSDRAICEKTTPFTGNINCEPDC